MEKYIISEAFERLTQNRLNESTYTEIKEKIKRKSVESIASEIIKAIDWIIYRLYNDGDCFYFGHGKEYCSDTIIYLIKHIDFLHDDFQQIIDNDLEGNDYSSALSKILDKIVEYLSNHPELFDTPLDYPFSSEDKDLTSYFKFPIYEFQPDISFDKKIYDATFKDIKEYINDTIDYGGFNAKVKRTRQSKFIIQSKDKAIIKYLESVWDNWFKEWLKDEHEKSGVVDWSDETDDDFSDY